MRRAKKKEFLEYPLDNVKVEVIDTITVVKRNNCRVLKVVWKKKPYVLKVLFLLCSTLKDQNKGIFTAFRALNSQRSSIKC
jgi:hypothetical protein